MSTITLNHGYYIEIDPLNYTLKQKFAGTTKNGEAKESSRLIGYYGNIRLAMERYLEMVQIDSLGEGEYTIEQYIEKIEECNRSAMEGIGEVLGRFPIK